jgi:thiamine biosynthesis protein ThiS
VQIYVNGKETETADGLTLESLVAEKGFVPGTVVVEHNLIISPKEKWAQMILMPEDKIEIIRIIGGG